MLQLFCSITFKETILLEIVVNTRTHHYKTNTFIAPFRIKYQSIIKNK